MRWKETFIPTLKELPAEAEITSHRLMLRAGLMRKLTSGVYTYLPLGIRAIKKVEAIVREEMDRAGGIELLLPILHPAELWRESGRWDHYGVELMRIKDRHGRNFALGPTHEEVITDLLRGEVRSYRDLPILLYQIQTKFRDEIRPRFGVIRAREFLMKDAYSFHPDESSLNQTYQRMYQAYSRIFTRCGLSFRPVEADSGAIGGDVTHEFMVLAQNGESEVFTCPGCSYAATQERAESRTSKPVDEAPLARELVHTPGLKTVEEVSGFLGVEPKRLVKTILYRTDGGFVAALIRGDREINEIKLMRALGVEDLQMATPDEILRLTGAPLGFSGPVGLEGVGILADYSLQGSGNFVVGANREDHHLINVNCGRDFRVDGFFDLLLAQEGDSCARCGKPLSSGRGIEVGQIFKLGTKYSESMKAHFLDQKGQERPFVMGCYGIGITRTVAAVIEQHHDQDGIIWPLSVAPYQVLILPLNITHPPSKEAAERLYSQLGDLEVLLDDREERAGVKFKDADLVGIPLRVTIGERSLKEGKVEIKLRSEPTSISVSIEEASQKVRSLLEKYRVSQKWTVSVTLVG